MLPDYPKVKNELQEFFNMWISERIRQHLGPLCSIPRHKIFEGTVTSMIRPDGQEEITPLRPYASEFEIAWEEVPKMTFPEIFIRLDCLAQDIADQLAQSIYKAVSNAADDVGNVVNLQGVGFTPQRVLEMFNKIDIPFDEEGNPELPSFHINPNNDETLMTSLRSIQRDPEVRAQYNEILQQKKEDWRVREAHRRLVG